MCDNTNQSESDKVAAGLMAMLYLILLVPLLMFEGYVLMTNWNWFVPLLGGPKMPSIGIGVGIALVASILTKQIDYNVVIVTAKQWRSVTFTPWLAQIIYLIVGAITAWYIGL